MIIQQEYTFEQDTIKKENLPTIQAWKGVDMIRIHSLRATIKEILKFSKSLDVVKIGVIGNQGTGKSTLAETLAHLIHKMSDIPFAIRIFDRDNLLNFKQTLGNLTPTNYILIFDDVSFLRAGATQKQVEIIKHSVTEIRHLPGGQDVKIILILNYHYTLGLDKYLRTADFRYFTSIGSSELTNMENIVTAKNMTTVLHFKKIFSDAIVKDKFYFKLKKGFFIYNYRKPFIPLLFYNEDSLRFVVSPTRHWIDKICSVCSKAHTEKNLSTAANIEEIHAEGMTRFGYQTLRAGLRVILFINGSNAYSKQIARCIKWFNAVLEKRLVNLEELATRYDLKETKAYLPKGIDTILSEPKDTIETKTQSPAS